MDMLKGKNIITSGGLLQNTSDYLKDTKILIFFFSASWVRTDDLVKNLKNLYEENQNRNAGMEIIYVSSDTDEKAFTRDFSEQGPWCAVPFKSNTSDELRWKFNITCLPQVIVVKTDGTMISRKGKGELEKLGVNVIVTWTDYVQR
ncbi:nucleoredoxin-like protein 2 [Leptinotarsa decemlineata]|uniref:nucleoredoxin-like protein 2 n=1 Tax=Leptinotarsa decemlineata TaxID=7539 RepID=UPI003D309910